MLKSFSRLIGISSKVSPTWIIRNHFDSLVDGKGNRHRPDVITFFVLPIIPAVCCKLMGAELDSDMVDILNTGLALFAGLFLSVSIQLIVIDKSKLTSDSARMVQKQIISNISFLILVGLLAIVTSYFSLFKGVKSETVIVPYQYYKIGIDVLVYYLLGIFGLTVLMILKRAAALFSDISK